VRSFPKRRGIGMTGSKEKSIACKRCEKRGAKSNLELEHARGYSSGLIAATIAVPLLFGVIGCAVVFLQALGNSENARMNFIFFGVATVGSFLFLLTMLIGSKVDKDRLSCPKCNETMPLPRDVRRRSRNRLG